MLNQAESLSQFYLLYTCILEDYHHAIYPSTAPTDIKL